MDRLLTAEEVAERLGMRTDWVWAQARTGRIPHVRLGRYRRFRESTPEAWICGLEAASAKPSQATANSRAVPLRRSAWASRTSRLSASHADLLDARFRRPVTARQTFDSCTDDAN